MKLPDDFAKRAAVFFLVFMMFLHLGATLEQQVEINRLKSDMVDCVKHERPDEGVEPPTAIPVRRK